MNVRIEQRLEALQKEMTEGHAMLKDLHERSSALNQRMLRISGAIQVLEELTADADESDAVGPIAVGQ